LQSLTTIQERRAASLWTRVHPVFAIGQLGVFVVSLGLLVLYFFHLVDFETVFISVLIKIAFMLGAIVTGALWEHDVYGKWWFAHEFFLEDVMTLNVFLMHAGFLVTVYAWPTNIRAMLAVLSVAYLAYGLNVVQYVVRNHLTREDLRASAGAAEAAA
jgi:3-vinyl bacteriochlorophyllide hydratase